MSFLETPRFPEDIAYGSSGGPMFKTTIVTTHSGHEQRNQEWEYPLHVYDVGYGLADEDDVLAVLEYFWAMGGSLHAFRFKDWADYSTGAPGGGQHSGPTITDLDQFLCTGVAGQTEVQLIKTYSKGSFTWTRKITKPVAGTVVGAIDGTPLGPTEVSVDSTTGIATLTTPLSGGEQVTGGFEFDVPVRFNEDRVPFTLESFQVMKASLKLMEIRI